MKKEFEDLINNNHLIMMPFKIMQRGKKTELLRKNTYLKVLQVVIYLNFKAEKMINEIKET